MDCGKLKMKRKNVCGLLPSQVFYKCIDDK